MTVSWRAVEGSISADTGKTEAWVWIPPRSCFPPPFSAALPSTPPHPRPPLPSPAGAVPGQHSPWGKLPGLLLKGQGLAPRQRHLGTGARGGRHTCAVVQQLGQRRLQLDSDPLLLLPHLLAPHDRTGDMAPRRTCCPGQPQPSWQGSCTQGAPGCRCEQRRGHVVAQALSTWPGGQSGGGGAQTVGWSPGEGTASPLAPCPG